MSTAMRMGSLFVLLVLCLCTSYTAFAQTETATLSGVIQDPKGGVVPDVEVTATRIETGTAITSKTNGAGIYFFTSLMPGHYHMVVRKPGFKEIAVKELELNVQDKAEQNFSLEIGSVSESVTITADQLNINTTDAAVSTVVHRQFLQDIPLNGRSIQTLLMLTPGVTFVEGGSQGQFVVNGMRTDSNYFTVDGVAANLGTQQAGNGLAYAAAGSQPAFNVLGGTNGIVSVDSIEEFRVQTSSFAPEYGRTPGAQVGIATRSGTNTWHGTAFEYLRNDLFDANDWFANHNNLPKPEERQNDFGGVLGGALFKSHSFFFVSYEGLRLRQPVTLEGVVPDATARMSAPPNLQPFLNAYPIPNAGEVGDDLAGYNTSVSNPATLDSFSIRIDQNIGSKFKLFSRYSYSPSTTSQAGSQSGSVFSPNNIDSASDTIHTLTFGLDETITNSIDNEVRLNYSNMKSVGRSGLSDLGGATPFSTTDLSNIYPAGVNPQRAQLLFDLFDGSLYSDGPYGVSEQRQTNVVDNLSIAKGSHLLKFGADFRWLAPFQGVSPYTLTLYFNGINGTEGVLSGQTVETDVSASEGVSIRSKNISLYGQDTWRLTPRLILTYGLRWDVNPAPTGSNLANDPLVVEGLSNLATMSLAPRGTPFYRTTYTNFAPRLGIAYSLHDGQRTQTVIRGGIGIFYDIGSGSLGLYSVSYPFEPFNAFPDALYPLPANEAAPPTVDLSGPAGPLVVAANNLALPRTYQWNLAVEQALGRGQMFSVTYLGSLGRKLLRSYTVDAPNPNFNSSVTVTTNEGDSNYQALQLKYQRQVSHGLQALASYTYSHSIDNASDDALGYSPLVLGSPNIDRASSNFDVRHSASGALTYDLPGPAGHGLAHAILSGWSVQDLIIARTAFPVNIAPSNASYFVGPYPFRARPNVVPGVPWYLYGDQYPGGKAFNPAAFQNPPRGTEGDLGRNALRGFGAWQDNFAVHRQFRVREGLTLQFRAEAFNLFNHPNFVDPGGFWAFNSPLFGKSTSSLATGSSNGGGGGLNSLYQIGAPRSWQFGLKLQF